MIREWTWVTFPSFKKNSSVIFGDTCRVDRQPAKPKGNTSMRWPLRNQILIRVLPLVILTILALTWANIQSAVSASRRFEIMQVDRAAKLLANSRISISPVVLKQMSQLSGAEFIITDSSGELIQKTAAAPAPERLPRVEVGDDTPKAISIEGGRFYHRVVPVVQPAIANGPTHLVNILVPRQSDAQIFWQASRSPLLLAAVVLPLAILICFALASQVSRRLSRLSKQADGLIEGGGIDDSLGDTDDEILDLRATLNQMADKIQLHERSLRKTERLSTLIQMGNGLAHNLRNSATGCQMALELLAASQTHLKDSEEYEVAQRQLNLINQHLKKFMSMSQIDSVKLASATIELNDVLGQVGELLKPHAQHLGVSLTCRRGPDGIRVLGQEEDVMQVMVNLISNAITAAVESAASRTSDFDGPRVSAELSYRGNRVHLIVEDNGSGPPDEIAEQLFEPFVTASREGIGLGLALVQKVAEQMDGSVQWSRVDGITRFDFCLGNCITEGDQ